MSDESGSGDSVNGFESAYKAFIGFLVDIEQGCRSGFAVFANGVHNVYAGFRDGGFDCIARAFGYVHEHDNSLGARFFHRNVRVVDTVHDVAVFHKVNEFFARHNSAVVFRLRGGSAKVRNRDYAVNAEYVVAREVNDISVEFAAGESRFDIGHIDQFAAGGVDDAGAVVEFGDGGGVDAFSGVVFEGNMQRYIVDDIVSVRQAERQTEIPIIAGGE